MGQDFQYCLLVYVYVFALLGRPHSQPGAVDVLT